MCARRRAHPAQAGRPESRHPPPSPTCPSARPAHYPHQHPSSTLCSVTHTHTRIHTHAHTHTPSLFLSLSPAVCQSLSPTVSLSHHFLQVASAPLFSLILFLSLHHSFAPSSSCESDPSRLRPLLSSSPSASGEGPQACKLFFSFSLNLSQTFPEAFFSLPS